MARGRKPLAERGIDELQDTLARRTAKGKGTGKVESLLNQRRIQGTSESQREGLFGRATTQAEAGAQSSIANLTARFGGDTQNPLLAFLAQTTQASAGAQTAASLADIEIEEGRRSQEVGLQSERLRLGFSQLGFEKEQFESEFDEDLQFQRGRAERSRRRGAGIRRGGGSKFGFFNKRVGLSSRPGASSRTFGRLNNEGFGIS